MDIDIVSGSSVPRLAQCIAKNMGMKAHFPFIEKFPDGEIHVIEGDFKPKETVVYVQTMHPRPNDMLVETLLTVDLLKELGTRRVIAVIPYLGYTRQDTRHVEGEAIGIRSVLKTLESCGVNDIVSVDLHLHRLSMDDLLGFSKVKLHEVSAIDLLASEAGKRLLKPVVIGPDSESERWAKRAADILETDYDVMEKHRLSAKEIEIKPKRLNVKNRDVLIIDDIVSTGGTMMEVIGSLRSQGANKITAAFTHAVLSDIDTLTGLFRAGVNELISTNSINNEFGTLDLSYELSRKLKEIL
ncbi:ribose-phosphate pyrophosphokinase [Methanocella sp. CWC-04]|uniref:ribose-phosphate diphosphokinase n=1 Tax=Methanooceanicella nereidis TaxID=2052831 RepID=A0AAP2RAQ9_9EURY|nr:ribose-phosphate diphosphokinase [Methanocella sp. CWC-04]MCD1293572.1 ribose-phosphate pyrophosphokinase [Methanocella sp. CWC-04]